VALQRNAAGATIKGTLQEDVYGYEFKAVVLERSPFQLKKSNICQSNGGWPQLIRDIDALILFADGFEDIIVPAARGNKGLCRNWQWVPRGEDYLATSVGMLRQLLDEAGCCLDRKFSTSKVDSSGTNVDRCCSMLARILVSAAASACNSSFPIHMSVRLSHQIALLMKVL
jgi:hypothetical protein